MRRFFTTSVRTLEQSQLAKIAFLGAAYFAAGKLGLLLTIPTVYASPAWPASGIALAGILIFGYRAWVGIFIGSLLLNINAVSLAAAASVGAGASLQALAGAFLVRRFVGFPTPLDEARDVIKFLILGGPLTSLVSATWGVGTLLLAGFVPAADLAFNWWTWWIGDSIGVLVVTPLVLASLGEPRESWRQRRVSMALPLCLMSAVAVGFFLRADRWEQDRIHAEFTDRATLIGDALQGSARRYLEVLDSIRDFRAGSPGFTWSDFGAFVEGPLRRYPGIQAVSWNPRISDPDREAYEKSLRSDGYPDTGITERNHEGRLVPAARRNHYVFVRYIEPYERNGAALGYDVASDSTRREALNRARDTGAAAATGRIALVQDARGAASVLVFLPVYRENVPPATQEQRRTSLLGYVTGVFRVPDVVASSAGNVDQAELHVTLRDASAPGPQHLLYANHRLAEDDAGDPRSRAAGAMAQDIGMDFAGRRWMLRVSPTAQYLRKHRGWQALMVLAAGMLLCGLFGAFLLVITGRTTRLGQLAGQLQFEATERSRAEDKIRRLNRVHAVLSGINGTIVRVRDCRELYREACRIAVKAGKFRMAWAGTYDSESKAVTPVACEGHEDGFLRMVALRMEEPVAEGRGLVRRAVGEMRPVILNDIEHDQKFRLRREALARGYRSGAVFPLIVDGDVTGVLGLFAEEAGCFDEEEMRLLKELAGDISFALDHIAKTDRLDHLAYYDSLTGLANRTLFHERLAEHARLAHARQDKFAVCVVDIDRFRLINDAFGRHAGDVVLKQVAERMTLATGGQDRLARMGADRFSVVIPGVHTEDAIARRVEEKLRACFAMPYQIEDNEIRLSAKMGIALFPSDGAAEDALLASAEAALKKAKTGGETYLFHTRRMSEAVAANLALENDLRQALERSEFVLHYQPKVTLDQRRIVGIEALIRWQSPKLGLVPPAQFIPLLEETGLIHEVGAWALRQAVQDRRELTRRGITVPRIAVNVSALQLRQRDFVERVRSAIEPDASVPGIDLEITESLIMQDIEGNIAKLKAIGDLGLEIAIDDFGTGYSSLAYLAKLPVHALKIDRSFVITMLDDADTMVLVQTIISLAHSLKLTVIAEGVESEEQAKVLKSLRCDQMQGYLFSKPLPREELIALLGRNGLPPARLGSFKPTDRPRRPNSDKEPQGRAGQMRCFS